MDLVDVEEIERIAGEAIGLEVRVLATEGRYAFAAPWHTTADGIAAIERAVLAALPAGARVSVSLDDPPADA